MLAKFLSRFGAAALLLAAMSVAASAQVVQATGKVTLKQADGTEVPVQNAVVKFYRTDIKQTFEAKTGKNGTYVHAGIPLVGTFTIAVSAPGARPSYIPNVPIGRKSDNNFALEPGDGSVLTLEQINASMASGGGGKSTPAAATPAAAPKLSEEDKKRAEAEAAERKRIEEQNAKAMELNTKLPDILKSGNDAFTAKRYDEAITFYDQGLALDPTQSVFHRNRGIVLRARGVEKFNTAAKAKDVPGKEAAKEDFKNSSESMEKALTAFRANASKGAGGAAAGAPGADKQAEELGYLFDRSESYRVALQTGAQVNTEAAIKAFEEYLAVETDPAKKMRGQNGLGDALFMGGKMDESIATFRQVIATNPQNLDAMTGLATALAAKGSLTEGGGGTAMIAEARDLFQEFIKKAPDTHPKKADAIATAQYLDETIKAANAPKPSTGGRTTGTGRRRP